LSPDLAWRNAAHPLERDRERRRRGIPDRLGDLRQRQVPLEQQALGAPRRRHRETASDMDDLE
jgi:hypothetical protein